jgi:electron transfer flavoprotein beta subunit
VHILACVKQILDPEIATTVFRVNEEKNEVVPIPGMSPVISPFDAQAVEAGMRLKETDPENIKLTVISMGGEGARATLKQGLAMGADEAVLLADPAFDGADSVSTARTLAEAAKKLGDIDLVITGRQAADGDVGVVGLGIAELLGLPAVTFVRDVKLDNGTLTVERMLEDGYETIAMQLPGVITIAHELGKPRYTSLRETMKAARKPTQVWKVDDLGLDASAVGAAGAHRTLERLFVPVNTIECEFIEAESAQAVAAQLAQKLKAAELI